MNSYIKNEDPEDSKELQRIAKAGSEKALRISRVMGLTVKIIRNNKIIEILPDGEERMIRTIDPDPVKVKGLKKGTVLCRKQQ